MTNSEMPTHNARDKVYNAIVTACEENGWQVNECDSGETRIFGTTVDGVLIGVTVNVTGEI